MLPEGVFNNPSLAYVREFCEDRAFIRAVDLPTARDIRFFRCIRKGVPSFYAEIHRGRANRL